MKKGKKIYKREEQIRVIQSQFSKQKLQLSFRIQEKQYRSQFLDVFLSPMTVFHQFDYFGNQSKDIFPTSSISSIQLAEEQKIFFLKSSQSSQTLNHPLQLQSKFHQVQHQKSFNNIITQHGQNGSESILRKNNQNSHIEQEYNETKQASCPTSQLTANKNQTNSWKNYIMNFYNFIGSDKFMVKQKFMKIQELQPTEHKYKKLVECLKKKIKKDKHTQLHLKSLLVYKDENHTRFLVQMCQNFLLQYPGIVKKSSKMTENRRNENLSIIPAVRNLLTLLRDPIFANFKQIKLQ